MAGLESEAAFVERAKAIGMREDFLKGLQSAGVKTFGKLAYICAGGPKAGDDGPLLAAVKTLTGNEPAGADLIDLRRLWAEAQALPVRLEDKGREDPLGRAQGDALGRKAGASGKTEIPAERTGV